MNPLNGRFRVELCAASGTETHREACRAPTATPEWTFPVSSTRILVAHGDPVWRHRLASALRLYGYAVREFGNGIDVLQFVADAPLDLDDPCGVDLIIADIGLAGWRGVDLLADFRYEGWSTPFVLTAEEGNERLVATARQLRMAAVLEEPVDVEDVLVTVTWMLELEHAGVGTFRPVVAGVRARTPHADDADDSATNDNHFDGGGHREPVSPSLARSDGTAARWAPTPAG
jgi:DNA-binding response OmpR family regulator